MSRCPACGSWRTPGAFGIGDDAVPEHEPAAAIQHIGGRGRCRWEVRALPREAGEELRVCLRSALARLEKALGVEDE